jgi:hypothetical protein
MSSVGRQRILVQTPSLKAVQALLTKLNDSPGAGCNSINEVLHCREPEDETFPFGV